MRIAVFHELHVGGARRAANKLAGELKKKHVVDLYTTASDLESYEKKNFTSISEYKFYPKRWSGRNWKVRIYKDTVELFNLHRLHRKISRNINSKNYDAVIIHPSRFTQAPFILKYVKKKTIYYCQEPLRISYEPEIVQDPQKDILRAFYTETTDFFKKYIDLQNVKSADLILANSKFTKKNIMKVYGRESSICYLGVDVDLFRPKKQKKTYDLLFIGNKTKVEGYSLLRETLSILRPKPSLFFLQFKNKWEVTDKKLCAIYNSSKITLAFAMNEPFGLIPLESMACGVPVIAVREGGYKETVKHKKTGFLIGRNSTQSSVVIKELLSSKKLREKLGRQGVDLSKNWTWEKSGRKLESLLLKITDEG